MTSEGELLDARSLINRFCDEALDDAEQRQLHQLLLRDAEARRLYYAVMELHSQMSWANSIMRSQQMFHQLESSAEDAAAPPQLGASPAAPVRSPVGGVPMRTLIYLSNPLRFGMLVATVTCVSLLLTAAQVRLGVDEPTAATKSRSLPTAPREFAARLEALTPCRWMGGAPRSELTAGDRLRLSSGEARLTFASGVRLRLADDAELRVESPMQVQLLRGKFWLHVPGRAAGFVAEAPGARIVDFGTEFGVRISDSQEVVHVQVQSGQVGVTPILASGAQPYAAEILHAGEALQVARIANSAAPRLTRGGFDADFARRGGGETLRPAGSVTEVVAAYCRDFNAFGQLPRDVQARRLYPENWTLFWTARGPLGHPDAYDPLMRNWKLNVFHPQTDHPSESHQEGLDWPKAYARLGWKGGHPGLGSGRPQQDAAPFDRYVVACVTAPRSGSYAIAKSSIWCYQKKGPTSPSIHLAVLVNDETTPRKSLDVEQLSHFQSFNVPLGSLEAGDRIWVAVGPKGLDINDSFRWDFQVVRELPSPSAP